VQAPDTRYYRPQLNRYLYRAVQIFCTENAFCAGYRCVQVIYVCGVHAQKYGIGLKLQACVATVLTAETSKRMTGLLVPIQIPTYTGEYRPIPDTGIGLTIVFMAWFSPRYMHCMQYGITTRKMSVCPSVCETHDL